MAGIEVPPELGAFLSRVERLDEGTVLALSARPLEDDVVALESARARAAQVAVVTGLDEARERRIEDLGS